MRKVECKFLERKVSLPSLRLGVSVEKIPKYTTKPKPSTRTELEV